MSDASGSTYRPGLGPAVPLAERLGAALERAVRFEFAVAYAKSSGVGELLGLGVPQRTRAVVGLGFGLSDPHAIERIDDAAVDVRCAVDTAALGSATFHPKLYLASRSRELVVLSGSANLTGGGLRGNVEQYEELRFGVPSEDADIQEARFDALWEYGAPLADLRRSGDWDDYIERARNRRRLEQDDRRRLARLNASTGRLLGQLARRDTRRAPGYLGITHPDWWDLQLLLRDRADRALFWRRNTNDFKALAHGGFLFHLVRHPSGDEELRSVAGYSTYPGVYEVGRPEDLWRRYGQLLGVHSPGEIGERLEVTSGRAIGVIHLEQLTELERAVPCRAAREPGRVCPQHRQRPVALAGGGGHGARARWPRRGRPGRCGELGAGLRSGDRGGRLTPTRCITGPRARRGRHGRRRPVTDARAGTGPSGGGCRKPS